MFKKLVLSALSVIVVLGSVMCASPEGPASEEAAPAAEPAGADTGVIEGESRPLGAGEVASFVTLDASGAPTSLGVKFTKSALDMLPLDCKAGTVPESSFWEFCAGAMNDALITILNAPPEASATNVATLELSWLPFGHAPEKIWDKPQFDIHFNFDMPAGGMEQSAAAAALDPGELPEGYMILPGSDFPWDTPAQKFHAHTADPKSSPEFGGGPFTTNFIYIVYGGNVIGYEPYVALDYLKGLSTTEEIPIKTPQTYPTSGSYPTIMRVGWDESMDAYVIALEGFQEYMAAGQ